MKILDRPGATVPVADRLSLETIPHVAAGASFAAAVDNGLRAKPKTLPCRFFYDERGSLLFEQITRLDEYYPTRVEREILERNAGQIAQAIGPEPELIELGSGSAAKTRLLIRALIAEHGSLLFRPIDIAQGMLEASSRALLADHPELVIRALAAEYEDGLRSLARSHSPGARLIAWLGSSIGNLTREAAADFLGRIRSILCERDRLLIGFDRRKDPRTLERAYDDSQGITAAFNLNLLERANRELRADFDLAQFEHRVHWRPEIGRIEMHLVSRRDQRVWIAELDASFAFERGETIHTENSYKYTPEEIAELAEQAGLRVEQQWTDPAGQFELSLLSNV
ncbi:MAG: L-histidine N(alpha)-methyltransferase [Myxococcota bacterium]|nr:L-histidine N(alpha)-methyltransferase [Myxococcota bacterium]